MDKATLGQFLAKLRDEKNITQEELAEKLDINYKTISKWECGNTTPDLITLMKLAEIYEVSLYEFSIGKRIKNPLISKKDLQRIINKKSLMIFIILKILFIILIILFLFYATFSIAYTHSNYNEVKIYNFESADKNLEIDGIFVKTKTIYYLVMTFIKSNDDYDLFLNDKTTSISYSIKMDNYTTKYKEINFEHATRLKDALSKIRFTIQYKSLITETNHFFINIKYRNQKNEEISKSFKIILNKKFANDKLVY